MVSSAEQEIFLLINVKMPTVAGILIFVSRKNSILGYLSLKKAEFLDICILLSILNFMLSLVEHENNVVTSWPELFTQILLGNHHNYRTAISFNKSTLLLNTGTL